MKIFDAHCHVGEGRVKQQTAQDLLRRMDQNEVDCAVIVPVEEDLAVYNEEGNAYILEQTRLHPDRLFGFATANPWYGAAAAQMIERYLGEGLWGLKFNPGVQGFHINDEIVYPLIEIAARHQVPVYFHTGTPVSGMPFQLYDLAKRYPEVSFIMGHSGWADFWQDIPFIAEHSKNIWFDTSLSYTSRTEAVIEACGCGRVVFGSDTPHSRLAFELEKVKLLHADRPQMEGILGGNLRSLLEARR